MARAEIRPHFDLHVPQTPDVVADRLRRSIGIASNVTGDVLNRHAQITIPAARRRVWSPWLTFEIEDVEGQTRLTGMFLPQPGVWTFFAATMAISLFVALGGLMWGFSQWMAGGGTAALWLVPLGLATAGGLYAGALLGQRLGGDEMDTIRGFVHEVLDVPAPPRDAEAE